WIHQKLIRYSRENVADDLVGDDPGTSTICFGRVAAGGEQYMITNEGKGCANSRIVHSLPIMVCIQSGAMIDEPGQALPDQDIGISLPHVWIGYVSVQPDDPGGELGGDEMPGRLKRKIEGPVEISKPEVRPMAGPQEILDLGVWFAPTERRWDVDQRN